MEQSVCSLSIYPDSDDQDFFSRRMLMNKLHYIYINQDYLNYIREEASWLAYSNYDGRYKPFIGILFQNDECCFVAPVSSYKDKYDKILDSPSFVGVYDHEYNKMISSVNLSRMFPVPVSEIVEVKYKNIEEYREFKDEFEKGQFIKFLKKQLKEINKLNIPKRAADIYNLKLSGERSLNTGRCVDFKGLECKCTEWILNHEYGIDVKIKKKGFGFLIKTEDESFFRNDLDIDEILDEINHAIPISMHL